jgi:DNA-binding beta-propeller fold protein YncE
MCTTCNALFEFSPLGAVSSFGVSAGDTPFSSPVAVAVDVNSSNVLVANSMGTTVTDFNVSSSTTSPIYTSGISKPVDVAVDGSGYIWVANTNNGANNVLKLTAGTGAVLATVTGNGLSSPIAMAIEPGASGNVWVANSGASNASVFTNAGAAYAEPTVSGVSGSLAIDSSGSPWIVEQGNLVNKFAAMGTAGGTFTITGPDGAFDAGTAIDGAGDVWVTDTDDQTIWELNNSGTNLSGTNGYTYVSFLTNPTGGVAPDGIAIDGSGNVWYSSPGTPAAVYELIGAGVPVVTPIAYGVAHSTLGTRP